MENTLINLWVALRWLAVAFVCLCLFFIFKNLFRGKPKYKVGEFLTLYGIPLEIKEVKYSKTKGWYYVFFHKERYCFTEREIARLIKK
jgi:hypothetical protein